jgi:hypothetical protein
MVLPYVLQPAMAAQVAAKVATDLVVVKEFILVHLI